MILNESNSSCFNIKTTGMQKYDDLLNNKEYYEDTQNLTYKIKWMHPSSYIKRCARDIFNVDYDRLFNNRNDHKISKYAKMMRNGEKFDMPVINYSTHNQEGLHRAISAMRVSDKDFIPVLVVFNKVPLNKFIPSR